MGLSGRGFFNPPDITDGEADGCALRPIVSIPANLVTTNADGTLAVAQ